MKNFIFMNENISCIGFIQNGEVYITELKATTSDLSALMKFAGGLK